MKKIPFARVLFSFAVLLCIAGGCRRSAPIPRDKLVTRSELAKTIGDREVRASIAGTAIIRKQDETAIISTETHRFTIARDRVLVNGAEIARVPADAKRVLFTIADSGSLSIEADGVALETKPYK